MNKQFSAWVNDGSILVFVLIVMTTLLILCASSWRMAYRSYQYAQARAVSVERWHAAQVLLDYGVAYCQEHQAAIVQKAFKEQTIIIDHWPPQAHDPYQAVLSLAQNDSGEVAIQVALHTNNNMHEPIIKHSCVMSIKPIKTNQGKFRTIVR